MSETSLVSPMCPQIFEVYGTKGVILCEDDKVRIKTADSQKYLKDGWVEPKLPPGAAAPHPPVGRGYSLRAARFATA